MKELNKYSKVVTQDETQPAAQAMLYGIGLTDSDMSKPQIGIASTGYEGNTCNMHLNQMATEIKSSVCSNDAVGLVFNTIGVSDGISNGTSGMRYSLVSREIIADSMEAVMGAHWYDGMVAVVGCDKNMPGSVMAMARLNRPSIMVFGGTIHSGEWKNEKLNIVSAFEALGKKVKNQISDENFKGIVKNACPGAGACGGMYTANTMAAIIEALGMSLPFSSSNPALSLDKKKECIMIGDAIKVLLEKDIKPKDIMTFKAFQNALRVLIVLGGSTNAVIHLLAIAKTIGVNISLDDFQKMSNETPVLADLKPSGKYLMEDLHDVGGLPGVMKYLLELKLIHGDCLTVTGLTLEENLSKVDYLAPYQDVILPVEKPVKVDGHIQILKGSLAPDGSVAKISGKEGSLFKGKAIVFNDEFSAIESILNGKVKPRHVVVIRYCGPKGGPGMPEMLKPTSAIMGAGLGNEIALITDGRFSGGTHGFVVGHISPEAFDGGPIALVQDEDLIEIDSERNTIELLLSEEELKNRKSSWSQPEIKVKNGVLLKYARNVSSASEGCLTDKL